MSQIAVALVHYPVLDRAGKVVTTAITNIDLHDIARSCLTYGVSDFFVVHPIAAQRELAQKVRDHWVHGSGKRRIPDRALAMAQVKVVAALDDADKSLASESDFQIWTTSALRHENSTDYATARAELASTEGAVLLVLGTGWGLADAVYQRAALHLDPIEGANADGYNHLSVRAATAITLDRLLARR